MLRAGVEPSYQLQLGIQTDGCSADGSITHKGGWTEQTLQDFLAFVGKYGINVITIWSNSGLATPHKATTCVWVFPALRDWVNGGGPSASRVDLKTDTGDHSLDPGSPALSPGVQPLPLITAPTMPFKADAAALKSDDKVARTHLKSDGASNDDQVRKTVVITASCPDPTDCTTSLQTALDTPAAAVIRVPVLPGRRWIVGDQSGGPTSVDPRVQANQSGIILGPASSHRTIIFDSGVEVLAKQGAFHRGQFFIGVNATNITILGRGAVWRMRKREYANSTLYTHSEDRHALALYGCSDITIVGLLISSSGGDGIYMTGLTSPGGSDNLMGYSRNIVLDSVVCDDHYRQGMSVISVIGLRVVNSTFSNTNGTPPAAGVDFEPNDHNNRLESIYFDGVRILNNSGNGIDLATSHFGEHPTASPLAMSDFTFRDLLIEGGQMGGIYWDDRLSIGTVVVERAVIRGTLQAALMLELTAAGSHHVSLKDVLIEDVAMNYTGNASTSLPGSRAAVVIGDPEYGVIALKQSIGGLSFNNVTIRDTFDRPWAATAGRGSHGAGDIMGNIVVVNPNGCWHELGPETVGTDGAVLIDVRVDCKSRMRDWVNGGGPSASRVDLTSLKSNDDEGARWKKTLAVVVPDVVPLPLLFMSADDLFTPWGKQTMVAPSMENVSAQVCGSPHHCDFSHPGIWQLLQGGLMSTNPLRPDAGFELFFATGDDTAIYSSTERAGAGSGWAKSIYFMTTRDFVTYTSAVRVASINRINATERSYPPWLEPHSCMAKSIARSHDGGRYVILSNCADEGIRPMVATTTKAPLALDSFSAQALLPAFWDHGKCDNQYNPLRVLLCCCH